MYMLRMSDALPSKEFASNLNVFGTHIRRCPAKHPYLSKSWEHPNTTRLANEVIAAIKSDPLYGPKHDRARHMIGIEYEVILEETLKSMGKASSRLCRTQH